MRSKNGSRKIAKSKIVVYPRRMRTPRSLVNDIERRIKEVKGACSCVLSIPRVQKVYDLSRLAQISTGRADGRGLPALNMTSFKYTNLSKNTPLEVRPGKGSKTLFRNWER